MSTAKSTLFNKKYNIDIIYLANLQKPRFQFKKSGLLLC